MMFGAAVFAQLKLTRELPPVVLSMLVADVSRMLRDTARPLMAPLPVPLYERSLTAYTSPLIAMFPEMLIDPLMIR